MRLTLPEMRKLRDHLCNHCADKMLSHIFGKLDCAIREHEKQRMARSKGMQAEMLRRRLDAENKSFAEAINRESIALLKKCL